MAHSTNPRWGWVTPTPKLRSGEVKYAERFDLKTLFDLNLADNEQAGCYSIIHLLDTLCTDSRITWGTPDTLARLKELHPTVLDELIINTMAIIAMFNFGKLLDITPIVQAGYHMRYALTNGRLSDVLWYTPRGVLKLEYRNASTRRLK